MSYLGSLKNRAERGWRKAEVATEKGINRFGAPITKAAKDMAPGAVKVGTAGFEASPYEQETARIAAAQQARAAQSQADQGPRNMQTGLATRLEAQSLGLGPSVADAQMRAAMDRSLAGQQASLAGARGINPALAMKLAAQQGASQRAELGQASGIARMQEQQGAQSQLAQALSQQRTGDIQAQQIADASNQFYEAQRTGNFENMQAASRALEELKFGAKKDYRQQNINILGAGGQAVATYASGGKK